MGVKLAEKILRDWPDHDIDVVIPIPDTSRVAGAELAARLGVPYREGFIKNRYIGRTFIMPDSPQSQERFTQAVTDDNHDGSWKAREDSNISSLGRGRWRRTG